MTSLKYTKNWLDMKNVFYFDIEKKKGIVNSIIQKSYTLSTKNNPEEINKILYHIRVHIIILCFFLFFKEYELLKEYTDKTLFPLKHKKINRKIYKVLIEPDEVEEYYHFSKFKSDREQKCIFNAFVRTLKLALSYKSVFRFINYKKSQLYFEHIQSSFTNADMMFGFYRYKQWKNKNI